MKQEQWEIEFDEKFALPLSPEGGINLIIRQIREKDRAEIKQFFRSVLAVERERAADAINNHG